MQHFDYSRRQSGSGIFAAYGGKLCSPVRHLEAILSYDHFIFVGILLYTLIRLDAPMYRNISTFLFRSSIEELESKLSRSMEIQMIKMLEKVKLNAISTKPFNDVEPSHTLTTSKVISDSAEVDPGLHSVPDFDPTLTSWIRDQVQSVIDEVLKNKTTNFPLFSSITNDLRSLQAKNSLNIKRMLPICTVSDPYNR